MAGTDCRRSGSDKNRHAPRFEENSGHHSARSVREARFCPPGSDQPYFVGLRWKSEAFHFMKILPPRQMRCGLLMLSLMGIANLAVAAPTPTPTPAGNGKIAFQSGRDGFGSSEIYVMDANGSNQTNLTNQPCALTMNLHGHRTARRSPLGATGTATLKFTLWMLMAPIRPA